VISRAVDFLAISACPDGSYPSTYASADACLGDVDTTAVVIQGLTAGGGNETAQQGALDWLVTQQGADGGWSSYGSPSVNSTALAIGVLGSQTDPSAKEAAVNGWKTLAGWQLPDGGLPAPGGTESDARATAQAALGLAETNYLVLLGISPKGAEN
jgi:hypothetical protein